MQTAPSSKPSIVDRLLGRTPPATPSEPPPIAAEPSPEAAALDAATAELRAAEEALAELDTAVEDEPRPGRRPRRTSAVAVAEAQEERVRLALDAARDRAAEVPGNLDRQGAVATAEEVHRAAAAELASARAAAADVERRVRVARGALAKAQKAATWAEYAARRDRLRHLADPARLVAATEPHARRFVDALEALEREAAAIDALHAEALEAAGELQRFGDLEVPIEPGLRISAIGEVMRERGCTRLTASPFTATWSGGHFAVGISQPLKKFAAEVRRELGFSPPSTNEENHT